jgi:hypothetical protein
MGHWMLNKAAFSLAPGSLPGLCETDKILGQALRCPTKITTVAR